MIRIEDSIIKPISEDAIRPDIPRDMTTFQRSHQYIVEKRIINRGIIEARPRIHITIAPLPIHTVPRMDHSTSSQNPKRIIILPRIRIEIPTENHPLHRIRVLLLQHLLHPLQNQLRTLKPRHLPPIIQMRIHRQYLPPRPPMPQNNIRHNPPIRRIPPPGRRIRRLRQPTRGGPFHLPDPSPVNDRRVLSLLAAIAPAPDMFPDLLALNALAVRGGVETGQDVGELAVHDFLETDDGLRVMGCVEVELVDDVVSPDVPWFLGGEGEPGDGSDVVGYEADGDGFWFWQWSSFILCFILLGWLG